MAGSQWLPVALAITDAMRTTTGYRHPESTSGTANGIPVFFGPEYGISEEYCGNWLCIGWSGDPDTPQSPGSVSQSSGPIGPSRARDESGEIHCRAVHQDGNTGDAALRAGFTAVAQVVNDVDAKLRADPLIGLSQPTMKWAFLTSGVPQMEFSGGVLVTFDFTITFEARI